MERERLTVVGEGVRAAQPGKCAVPRVHPRHSLYPNGYQRSSECLLNAVWEEAEQHADLFGSDSSPDLTSTRGVVWQILGLCLAGALITQVDAQTLFTRYPQIAQATQRNLSVDIPLEDLPVREQQDRPPTHPLRSCSSTCPTPAETTPRGRREWASGFPRVAT
ncbi:MAG: hypothetical protein ABI746_09370 [Dermatophilaceae bacterium]